jgi:integrase
MSSLHMTLSDKAIDRLAPAESGQYKVRDADLKGFYVLVGKRRRTYMVQGDLRRNGKRAATINLSIGDATQISSREARGIAKTYLGEISQGRHPKPPPVAGLPVEDKTSPIEITLGDAWERYRDAHLIRKGRSEGTIAGYRDHVENLFKDWLDRPLRELGESPALVADRHDQITTNNGPYRANGSMRTLRAIYKHARRTHRQLPVDNPVDAVDWNKEERRNTAMGVTDLPSWFSQLATLHNPIRREFHLLVLLSGCRPTAMRTVRFEHLDIKRRVLHIAKPKGGIKRAFDIPLSRQMIRAIVRVIRVGRQMYPDAKGNWLFPADSGSGHIGEHKEDRSVLSKWGNDLRQSYRTLATVAGVSEIDAKLLMNHAIAGVNSGYITRHKLLEGHLRYQQQMISDIITVGDKARS